MLLLSHYRVLIEIKIQLRLRTLNFFVKTLEKYKIFNFISYPCNCSDLVLFLVEFNIFSPNNFEYKKNYISI